MVSLFRLRSLQRFVGRCVVWCEGKGSGIFAMGSGQVAVISEKPAELEMDLEGRSVVGLCR